MNKYVFKTFLFVTLFVIIISSMLSVIKIYGYSDKEIYLQGKTILIDPGHGGKDDGASVGNVLEDCINLKISGYLLEELVGLGANVLISRTGDYDLSSVYKNNKKREDLNNRVKYINESEPDLFVSIHLNSFNSSDVEGAQVFYQNNEQSRILALSIQNELNGLNNKTKKIKLGNYFILNKSVITGVLVECGFLSNNRERENLNTPQYQKKIAKVIKKGIVNFFVEKQ